MSMAGAQFLFNGAAAMTSQGAAGFILTTPQHSELFENLTAIHSQLQRQETAGESWSDLGQALSHLDAALQDNGDNSRLETAKAELARIVAQVPDRVWRAASYEFMTTRDQHVTYLVDILAQLSTIAGSRLYAMSANDEDKAFIRVVMGGLSIFLNNVDSKANRNIAGMVEEVSAQIQDETIQRLSLGLHVTFSTPPSHVLRADSGIYEPVPTLPAAPAAETATTLAPPSTQIREPVPASIEQVPFNYHSASDEPHAHYEGRIQKIYHKMQSAGIAWPYDFVRWARSLYLYASELPNGDSSRILRNITQGLTRLDNLATLNSGIIRRILGPASVAIGRPLHGLPEDWPRDMANDMGSDLVFLWDASQDQADDPLRTLVSHIIQIWRLTADHEEKQAIRHAVKLRARRLQRSLERHHPIDFAKQHAELAAIEARLAGAPDRDTTIHSDTATVLGLQADDGQQTEEAPQLEPLETMSQAEWIAHAMIFLHEERLSWGHKDDDGPLAQRLDHVTHVLGNTAPTTERARDLLSLLFQMTLHYRQTLGVSGEAAFFRSQDATTPLGLDNMAQAYEEITESTHRGDLLREWADECSKSDNYYSTLLGEEGLSDLVGTYLDLVEQDTFDPLERASRQFAHTNPQLHLSPVMVRRLLAYFIGARDSDFQEALYNELIEALPAAEAPMIDIDPEDLGEKLFRDIDPERFTEFGMIFIKVAAIHRPTVGGGHPRYFMFFVDRLWRLYRAYCNQLQTSGIATFESAWREASKDSKYKNDQKLLGQYRGLFETLLSFLTDHRDLANHIHLSLLEGDTAIYKKRPSIPVAGGPAPEKQETVTPQSSEQAQADLPENDSRERPANQTAADAVVHDETANSAADTAARAAEAVYTEPAVVSPDAAGDNGNPFADTDMFIASGTTLVAAVESKETAVVSATTATPKSTEPTVEETQQDKPAPPTLPRKISDLTSSWSLQLLHEQVILDMLDDTDELSVYAILQNMSQENRRIRRGLEWLERYAALLRLKRLSTRAKEQLLTLMSDNETFRQIATLLMATAVKPTEIVLDRILPQPLQLGRKFGRHVSFDYDQDTGTPFVQMRPAVSTEEGEFHEKAIMPSGASVQVWNDPRRTIDIGVRGNRYLGHPKFIRMILKAAGAVASTERTTFTMLVTAKGMTERARYFFFKHHPRGRLIVWHGRTFSIYRATTVNKEKDRFIETVTRYREDGSMLHQPSTNDLLPADNALPIQVIGATDWNPATHRVIVESTDKGAKRLQELDQAHLIPALEAARDHAIYTIGFLDPDHPDTRTVLRVLEKLTPPNVSAERIRATIEELNWTVMEIAERFAPLPEEAPQPTDVPKLESEPAADKRTEKVPWNQTIAAFLDQVINGVKVRRIRSLKSFLSRGRKHIWFEHLPEIRRRIISHLESNPHPRQDEIMAELAQFDRNRDGSLSKESLTHLVRIAAIITNSMPVSNASEASGSTAPWTQDMRIFLALIIPKRARLSMKRCYQVETFIDHARRRLRMAHQDEIIANVHAYTASHPELAEAINTEIDAFQRARKETLAANTVMHLVRIAMIATGYLTTTPPRESTPPPEAPRDTSIPPPAPKPTATASHTIQSLMQTAQEMGQTADALFNELGTFPAAASLNGDELMTSLQRLIEMKTKAETLVASHDEKLEPAVYSVLDSLDSADVDTVTALGPHLIDLNHEIEFKLVVYTEALERVRASQQKSESVADNADEVEDAISVLTPYLETTQKTADAIIQLLEKNTPITLQEYAALFQQLHDLRHRLKKQLSSLRENLQRQNTQITKRPELAPYLGSEATSTESLDPRLQQAITSYRDIQAKVTELSERERTQIPKLIADLAELESELPLTPEHPLPETPMVVTQRGQARTDTDPEILAILAQVPTDVHTAVHLFPEFALLAPDHEVYERQLRVLALAKRYRQRGYYCEYMQDGQLHWGYVKPSFFKKTLGSTVSVIDADGNKQSIQRSDCHVVMPLSGIQSLERYERNIRNPALYTTYKLTHLLDTLSIPGELHDDFESRWHASHDPDNFIQLMHARVSYLERLLAHPTLRTLLLKNLFAKVAPETVRNRLRHAFSRDKQIRRFSKSLQHILRGQELTQAERLGALYIYAYPTVFNTLGKEVRQTVSSELEGDPLTDFKSDSNIPTWTERVIGEWFRASDKQYQSEWQQWVMELKVFATPDESYLVAKEAADTAAAFLAGPRAEQHVISAVTLRKKIIIPNHGRGYQLRDKSELPTASSYRKLVRRLQLLGQISSPVLPIIMKILSSGSHNELGPYREDLIGVIMTKPSDELTAPELHLLVARWILSQGQLRQINSLRAFTEPIDAAVQSQASEQPVPSHRIFSRYKNSTKLIQALEKYRTQERFTGNSYLTESFPGVPHDFEQLILDT